MDDLTAQPSNSILQYFAGLDSDESWTFGECTTRDTAYITHGYHRYPAKFIPQLASRLISELSSPGELVVDPFMGSGTTLIEAKVLGRPSIGVDINPVARLISKAKVTAIEPAALDEARQTLRSNIAAAKQDKSLNVPEHDRIDYWFKPETKKALSAIYVAMKEVSDERARTLFLCGFSHILKNCSIWLMKSSKPTRDLQKVIPDPYQVFESHLRQMIKKNEEFWEILQSNGTAHCTAVAYQGDARKVPAEDNSAILVVTSPPYVTSYEYADLHQLTALWFGYAQDLQEFRKPFIGSAHIEDTFSNEDRRSVPDEEVVIGSEIGERTVEELKAKKTGKDTEVAVYFSEMRESFLEMRRYLREGGKACIVIGDTAFKKVPVPNAEIFAEQMLNQGFRTQRIIKRRIPSKILPQTRDPHTGRFTASSNRNKTLAYPHEYIVIMEKV